MPLSLDTAEDDRHVRADESYTADDVARSITSPFASRKLVCTRTVEPSAGAGVDSSSASSVDPPSLHEEGTRTWQRTLSAAAYSASSNPVLPAKDAMLCVRAIFASMSAR